MHADLVGKGFLAYLEGLSAVAHGSANTLSQSSVFHEAEPYDPGSCNSTDLDIDYIYLPFLWHPNRRDANHRINRHCSIGF